MKKLLILLVLASIMVVGGIGYTTFHDKAAAPTITNTLAPNSATFKKACDVFSQADAEIILGGAAAKTDTTSADLVSAAMAVTNCSYSLVGGDKTAGVLIRASNAGQAKTDFNGAKLSDAQPIDGLGVTAYWNPTYGQLNLLVKNNWVILTFGGALPSQRTSADALPLARLIVSRL